MAEDEKIEMGFFRWAIWNVQTKGWRGEVAKARAEIILLPVLSTYNLKFGTFMFGSHLDYRSAKYTYHTVKMVAEKGSGSRPSFRRTCENMST